MTIYPPMCFFTMLEALFQYFQYGITGWGDMCGSSNSLAHQKKLKFALSH